jgi:hypothetical protein
MDSAVLRLPSVLLFAGRAADLGSLGAKADLAMRQQVDTRVAVARYQVSLESDEIASGLRKSLDVTTSTSLGPNITNQLDTFRTAVDAFVPPVNLLQNLDNADPATVTANADRVRDAARKLSVAVLGELDKLIGTRNNAQSLTRSQGLALGVLCVLLTGMLIWMLVKQHQEETEPVVRQQAVPQPPARTPRATPREDIYNSDEPRAADELVQAGRAIRARRRERADDAR